MFLRQDDPQRPIRNAYYYSANRIFAVVMLQCLIVGLFLGLVPFDPTDPGKREIWLAAALVVPVFMVFWWVARKGIRTEG